MITVNLRLKENEELNCLACYKKMKQLGFSPKFESMLESGTRPLRFSFKKYYFNIFTTGKINVFTSKNFNRRAFQKIIEELQELIFKENIVKS